jgi:hypothetical protein
MKLQPSWCQVGLVGLVAVLLSALWAWDLAVRRLTDGGSAIDVMTLQLVSIRGAMTAKRWLGLAFSASSFSDRWAAWSSPPMRVTSWPKRLRVHGAFVCLVRN